MASEKRDWKQQAMKRFEERLDLIKEQLGEDPSFFEIEELLIEHENAIMRDTLEALTEGVSPPQDKKGT